MVLGGLLKGVTQLFDDDGFAATSSSNLAESSVISGDLTTGYISAIWDFDITTFVGNSISAVGTKTITFDMLTRRQNVVLTCYYSLSNTAGPDTASLVVEYSDDNATWTNIDTLTLAAEVTQTKIGNLSANFSARYIRFHLDVTIRNSAISTKIFDVKIVKAMT